MIYLNLYIFDIYCDFVVFGGNYLFFYIVYIWYCDIK